MSKEKTIKMVELELDLDDTTINRLVEYASKNILNDKVALINWAANDVLRRTIEEKKEKENGKSNRRR